ARRATRFRLRRRGIARVEMIGQQRAQQRRHGDERRLVGLVSVAAGLGVVAAQHAHVDALGSCRTTIATWIRYSTPDHRYMAIPQIKNAHPHARTTRLHSPSNWPSRTRGKPDISAKVAALPT